MNRRAAESAQGQPGPLLRIYVLGPTLLQREGRPRSADWLGQRPGHLLKVLITQRPRVLHAEELAETLWPGGGASTVGNVRHFVHALREDLDPDRAKHSRGSFIVTRNGGYALELEHVWVDADDFEQHVAAAFDAHAAGDTRRTVDHLTAAMALYRGDFLEDEPYADWALAERDRLRVLAARALQTLASVHERTGDTEGALTAMQRLGELEPFDLDIQRSVIMLCLRTGRRGQALRRYDALRHRMNRTFGEDLTFTLADLMRETSKGPLNAN
jgi:DNA-binding SARP family transcriptional activator